MARAALNWTVRELAEAAGLHRNTITNIETGRYAGDLATLQTIGAVLKSGARREGSGGSFRLSWSLLGHSGRSARFTFEVQFDAGACRPCDQPAGPVFDIAFDVPHGATCFHDPGLGGQGCLSDRAEKVDLQLDGCERLGF